MLLTWEGRAELFQVMSVSLDGVCYWFTCGRWIITETHVQWDIQSLDASSGNSALNTAIAFGRLCLMIEREAIKNKIYDTVAEMLKYSMQMHNTNIQHMLR